MLPFIILLGVIYHLQVINIFIHAEVTDIAVSFWKESIMNVVPLVLMFYFRVFIIKINKHCKTKIHNYKKAIDINVSTNILVYLAFDAELT